MMIMEKYKRYLVVLILMCFLFTSVLPIYAQDSTVSARSASILQAIRTSTTDLDLQSLSKDDVKVFGLFLSNYFTPGVTKAGDVKEAVLAAGEDLGIGSTAWLLALGEMLSVEFSSSGRESWGTVYDMVQNKSIGKLNLNLDTWSLALQASFAKDPAAFIEMLQGTDSRNLNRVLLDSIGNLWIEDTLFIPAVLNPNIFGGKISLNNSFILGSFLRVDHGPDVNRPYYTLAKQDSILNLLGIRTKYNLSDMEEFSYLDGEVNYLLSGLTSLPYSERVKDNALASFLFELVRTRVLTLDAISDSQSFMDLSQLKNSDSLVGFLKAERLLRSETGSLYQTREYTKDPSKYIKEGDTLESLGYDGMIAEITFKKGTNWFSNTTYKSFWGLLLGDESVRKAKKNIAHQAHLMSKRVGLVSPIVITDIQKDKMRSVFYEYETFHLKGDLGIGSKLPMLGFYITYMIDFLGLQEVDGAILQQKEFSAGLSLPSDSLPLSGGSVDWSGVLVGSAGTETLVSKELSESEKQSGLLEFMHAVSTGKLEVIITFLNKISTSLVVTLYDFLVRLDVTSGIVSTQSQDSFVPSITLFTSLGLGHIPGISFVQENLDIIVLGFLIILLVYITFNFLVPVVSKVEIVIRVFLAIIVFFGGFSFLGSYSDMTDSMVNRIFSSKLQPWALVQDQVMMETMEDLDLQRDGISDAWLDTQIALSELGDSEYRSTDPGLRVKWMSPKKENIFDLLYSKHSALDDLGSFKLLKSLFTFSVDGVEYTDDRSSVYIYRPYTYIVREARELYKEVSTVSGDPYHVKSDAEYYDLSLPDYRFKYWSELEKEDRLRELYAREQLDDIRLVGPSVSDDRYKNWHLASDGLTKSIFTQDFGVDIGGFTYTGKNPSESYFANLTESPYYYFYNSLKTKYGDDFKKALLRQSTFEVTPADIGVIKTPIKNLTYATRDFADIKNLFTYVIPYMQSANKQANKWFGNFGYGLTSYKGSADSVDGLLNLELIRKETYRKHWNLYSSWVDHITDHSYRKPILTTSGQKVVLENALDPGAYLAAGRSMVFSQADMLVKGLRTKDLTDVEQSILVFQDKAKVRLQELSGYQGFDDEVLLGMAAMILTEEFNTAFSTSRTVLQPTSIELKNIDFSVLMRMLFYGQTGENPLVNRDDPLRQLMKTEGLFVGIVLVSIYLLGSVIIPVLLLLITLLIVLLFPLGALSLLRTKGLGETIRELFRWLSPLVALIILRVSFSFALSTLMISNLSFFDKGTRVVLGSTFIHAAFILVILFVYFKLILHLLKYTTSLVMHLIAMINPILAEGVTIVSTDAVGIGSATLKNGFRLVDIISRAVTGTVKTGATFLGLSVGLPTVVGARSIRGKTSKADTSLGKSGLRQNSRQVKSDKEIEDEFEREVKARQGITF